MQSKKKVLIITAVGLALLTAVIGAALNAVFTVTEISVDYFPVSEEGKRESYRLQEDLDREFLGSSTAFLDLEEVKKVVSAYPAFELSEAKKDYPAKLVLRVTERREVFAVKKDDGKFAILDETGRYLYEKEENVNRTSGENILLEGFTVDVAPGERVADESFSAALEFVNAFSEHFGTARLDLRSVSLQSTQNALAGASYLQIITREGVRIDVYEPCRLTRKKADVALEKYLSLEGTERLCGFFDIVERISEGEEGEITASEHRTDIPIGI